MNLLKPMLHQIRLASTQILQILLKRVVMNEISRGLGYGCPYLSLPCQASLSATATATATAEEQQTPLPELWWRRGASSSAARPLLAAPPSLPPKTLPPGAPSLPVYAWHLNAQDS